MKTCKLLIMLTVHKLQYGAHCSLTCVCVCVYMKISPKRQMMIKVKLFNFNTSFHSVLFRSITFFVLPRMAGLNAPCMIRLIDDITIFNQMGDNKMNSFNTTRSGSFAILKRINFIFEITLTG